MHRDIRLNQPATGFRGCIRRIDGDRALHKKLLSLGLRRGQAISVLHRRASGVVVSSNGNRIALGANIAAKIVLTPLDAGDEIQAPDSSA